MTIVRILLWDVGDAKATIDELRDRVEEIEPLPTPGAWLVNEGAERFGALVVSDEDDDELPPQVGELRALVGKDPDVYEEFDAVS
jgi:hypothetical protein